jgi:leader peptidase (prepilin peptidase) / N-methyltransferase
VELILIFILGLCVGSFLNVLVDRLPKEESIVKGRSHCEKCKKELAWFDLIPLVSFLSLQGKCRYCRTPLSLYYPVVEFATGVLFVTTLSLSGGFRIYDLRFMISLGYYLFITSSLIVVFFTDLKYGIIPDKVIVPAILISFLYLILNTNYLILPHLLSALGACLFFLILFLITKGKGMGFGDVKFAFLMGLVLGFPNIIVSLYIAFLTGAIVGCILIIWRKRKLKGASIPFGPFLVLGTFIAISWGELILQKITAVLHW